MSKYSTKPHNRVTYELYHEQRGVFELKGDNEPLNWENDLKDYKSSKEYAGIFNKFSTNLTFPKGAHDWLYETYKMYTFNTPIYLRKYIIHPKKSEIVKSYESILDGWTFKKDGGKIGRKAKVKAEESDLISKIKARQNEKIDLTKNETLNGTPLPPLKKHKVRFSGKRLFLKTIFEVEDTQNKIELRNETRNDNNRGSSFAFPIKIKARSHENAQSPFSDGFSDNSSDRTGNADNGDIFYAVSDRDRELDITINVSFDLDIIETTRLNSFKIGAYLKKYKDGIDYIYKETVDTLYETTSLSDDGNTINLSYNGRVKLLKGESLGFLASQYMDGKDSLNHSRLNVDFKNITGTLQINENSVFPESYAYCLLPHEKINRALQIITNRTDQVLYSELFGLKEQGYKQDGKTAYLGTTIGWWIRGFDNKDFTTSFKDLIDSYKVAEWCDYGTIQKRGKEMLLIEEKTFFNQNKVVIDLPNQIQSETRSVAVEYAYSSIEIGYQKGGANYESFFGLVEPMGKHNYITPITRENKLVLVSKYEADPTRVEMLRRLSVKYAPDRDTRDDKTIVFLDMKKTSYDYLDLRTWQDDFDTEPVGVFSPETYFNYRLLPKQLFYKHSRSFTMGFYGGKVTLASYVGKVDGVALQNNGKIMEEGAEVDTSTLPRPLHSIMQINFTHDVDYLLSEKIEGTTIHNGREIPNIYFQTTIINEYGEKEYVKLKDITPSNGKFTKALILR